MSTYNFCDYLGGRFGKFYDNVSLEKIDGVTMPVHYNGTDFINLHPKDNQCELCYIRQVSEGKIDLKDLGGCQKSPYLTEYYRFVNWSNKPFKPFTRLQNFVQSMKGLNIEILGVNTNPEQVYSQETGKGKYIKLKDISYLYIDFKITKKVDSICIPEC